MEKTPFDSLGGMISGLRVVRSTNSVVALMLLFLTVIFVTALLAPLEAGVQYAVLGMDPILGISIYCAWWLKAKDEPLSVTEKFWIAALPYVYGQKGQVTTRQDELEARKTEPPDLLPPARPEEIK